MLTSTDATLTPAPITSFHHRMVAASGLQTRSSAEWPPDRILALLKFGRREHIEELVTEGHLFRRPLADFVPMEEDELRGDRNEGLTSYIQASGGEFRRQDRNGQWQTLGTIMGPLRYRDPGALDTTVFCGYALRASASLSLINQSNLRFGDTFAIFTEGDEFLRRVRAAAERDGLQIQTGLVKYVDPTSYNRVMGPFRKLSTFAYQSEFRLIIAPGTGMPPSLRAGSLADIAIIGPSARVNERFRIQEGRVSFRTSDE